MTEESMRLFGRKYFVSCADAAVKQAYWQALASSSSVLVIARMAHWLKCSLTAREEVLNDNWSRSDLLYG